MEAALQVEGTSIYARRAITALALGGSEGVGQLAGWGWKVLPLGLCVRHCWHSSAIPHMPGIPHRPPEIYSSSLISASQSILV